MVSEIVRSSAQADHQYTNRTSALCTKQSHVARESRAQAAVSATIPSHPQDLPSSKQTKSKPYSHVIAAERTRQIPLQCYVGYDLALQGGALVLHRFANEKMTCAVRA